MAAGLPWQMKNRPTDAKLVVDELIELVAELAVAAAAACDAAKYYARGQHDQCFEALH